MQKILKMTDITETEVRRELSYIRYSSLLSPEVSETNEGTVLRCEVNEQNRLVFAQVLAALSQYVYTDTNQTALERLCDIAEVRGLKLAFLEQGTRGKLCSALLETSNLFDNNVACGLVGAKRQFLDMFRADSIKNVAMAANGVYRADACVVTIADFEENPLVPTECEVCVCYNDLTTSQHYKILGTKQQVADRLMFLSACYLIKKVF